MGRAVRGSSTLGAGAWISLTGARWTKLIAALTLALAVAHATIVLQTLCVDALEVDEADAQRAALRGALAQLLDARAGLDNAVVTCREITKEFCSTASTVGNEMHECDLWCYAQKNWDGRSCKTSRRSFVFQVSSLVCEHPWAHRFYSESQGRFAQCRCECSHENCGLGEDDKMAIGNGDKCKDKWYTTPAWGSSVDVKQDRCDSWCSRQGCGHSVLEHASIRQWYYLCGCQ